MSIMAVTLLSAFTMTAVPLKVDLRDGTILLIDSEGLEMTFSSSALQIESKEGRKDIPLSEISSFYFQAVPSSVADLEGNAVSTVELFSVDGCPMGRFASLEEAEALLSRGTYIVKSQSGTNKILFR
ncbi:MAG: hypothetical protein HDS31_06455 [Bacteroides sp.]|nr:hypothetical protein [Bacteroides sp.]